MKKNKLLSLTLMVLFLSISWQVPIWAQISYGGSPSSFTFTPLRSSTQPYEAEINFNVKELIAADAILEASGLPPRVAKVIPVSLNTENSGEWFTLPNGTQVWKLTISAPDALATMLLYEKFEIPEGGKLFIYTPDHSMVLGSYTSKTNPLKAEFATEFVRGDELVLEYDAPAGVARPQLLISGIGYGYNYIEVPDVQKMSYRGTSQSCEVNINCPEGANWQDEKKGVVRLITPTGGGYISLCSGSVVNTTAQDLAPMILSAHHCFSSFAPSLLNQTIYYFHFELPGCSNQTGIPESKTITGAQLLVDIDMNGGSDGALLQLNESIPDNYDVYYNGWDRTNVPATSGVGIHHPQGDVKKISTYTTTNTTSQWNGDGATGAPGAHWNAIWASTASGWGVTEGGSSGSPLFNQDGRIVGTLTGGNSSCANTAGRNLYGKLWYHWDQAAAKMAPYLDPGNTGATFIDGTYTRGATAATFFASDTAIYASKSITFIDRSNYATTWKWTFDGGTPTSFTGKTPPAIVYNTAGTFTAKLVINEGTPDEKEAVKTIHITLKENQCPKILPAIGAATTTSQFPLGALQRQSFSSAIYTSAEIDTTGTITHIAWDASAATTRTRTLYVYLKETDETTVTANTWSNEIAGATLVYRSSDTWTNAAGWVDVALTTPFRYSGTKNLKVLVRTVTTAASGYESSDSKYTATTGVNRHMEWTDTGTAIPATNGIPNENRPNIRFTVNENCGIVPLIADFIANGLSATSIFEGEQVTFADLSAGPPVSWSWSFPGGNPSTSTEQNPVVTYMNDGVYNVSLTVTSTLGQNTKTVAGMITVSAQTPIVDFQSSSSGFKKADIYGQFLPPTGGLVSFEDLSENYPESFSWTLPGGTPSSSSLQNVEVTYPAGNNSYEVSHQATNEGGTGQLAIPGYVQVGGKADIWNLLHGETADWVYTYSTFYITAPGDLFGAISERFSNTSPGEISKVKIYTEKRSGDPGMTVQIFSDNDGYPGVALSPIVVVANSDVNNDGYTVVNFTYPVAVSGNFHVVMRRTGTGMFVVPCVSARNEGNTVCGLFGSDWRSLNEMLTGFYTSLNVIPEFTYVTLEPTTATSFKKKNIDPQAETVSFTTNSLVPWITTASDPWIVIQNGSGIGNGSFTFTCTDNTGGVRNGLITISTGAAKKYIIVQQTGTNPENLVATGNDYPKRSVDLTWGLELRSLRLPLFNKVAAPAHTQVRDNTAPKAFLETYQVDHKISTISDTASKLQSDGIRKSSTVGNKKPYKPTLEASYVTPTPLLESTQEKVQLRSTAEAELRWDDGTYFRSVGLSSGGNIEVAILFGPSDLYPYEGTKIKAVEIFPKTIGSNMILKIRQGNVIIHSQPISGLTAGRFNRISLTQPIVVDAAKELMVSYSFVQAPGSGNYVPGADAGPAFRGKGDLISIGGAPFEALSAISTLDCNWNISVILEDNVGPNADVTYNVYRDNVLLAQSLTAKTYRDQQPVLGRESCYTLTAVYNATLESTKSNQACVTVSAIKPTVIYNQPEGGSICSGNNYTFTVGANGEYLSYRWQKLAGSKWADIPENNGNNSYVISKATSADSGMYRVQIVGIDSLVVTSREVALVVNTPAAFTTQPSNATICQGSTYTINPTIDGNGLTYQWYMEDNPIAGATGSTYTITNASLERDYGNYKVAVKGTCGVEVVSEKARIWVADSIPASSLIISDIPDVVEIGHEYKAHIGNRYGFNDVTNYQWSFSNPNAVFAENNGISPYTAWVTFGPQAQSGTLTVKMEHACKTYIATKQVQVGYPTAIDNASESNVSVYPNPVKELLFVDYKTSIIKEIAIAGFDGRIMYQAQPNACNLKISIANWPTGVYFVKVTTEEGVTTWKILKN